jgi:hypothetical protein
LVIENKIRLSLYFYFSGLSLRRTSQKLSSLIKRAKPCFHLEMGTKLQTKEAFLKEKDGGEFFVDETLYKVGSELVWL